MRLSFTEESGQSRAPSRSRTRAPHSRAEEGQSSPTRPSTSAPPQTPAPISMFGASIKSIVEKAISDSLEPLMISIAAQNTLCVKLETEFEKLTKKFEDSQAEVTKQLVEIVKNHKQMVDNQDDQVDALVDMTDILDNMVGQFVDLNPKFTTLHDLYRCLDTKMDKWMSTHPTDTAGHASDAAGPSGTHYSSPDPSPHYSPPEPSLHQSSPPTSFPPHSSPIHPPSPHSPLGFSSPIPVTSTPILAITPTTIPLHPSPASTVPLSSSQPSPSSFAEALHLLQSPLPVTPLSILPPDNDDDKGGEE